MINIDYNKMFAHNPHDGNLTGVIYILDKGADVNSKASRVTGTTYFRFAHLGDKHVYYIFK